jgi:hypothetical protein
MPQSASLSENQTPAQTFYKRQQSRKARRKNFSEFKKEIKSIFYVVKE